MNPVDLGIEKQKLVTFLDHSIKNRLVALGIATTH